MAYQKNVTTLARRQRMAKVLQMAEAGISYRAIGEKLGISHTQARRDHTRALQEVTLPLAEEIRKVHHARLETLYALSAARAHRERDMRAAQVALNTLAQQARMYGTDQPSMTDGVQHVRTLLEKLLED